MKDETTINSYELTLTPNYVSDWNFNDALRELIQNGTDQEVLDPDNEFQIDYSQQECWRPMSRQELRQKKMQAACTECGLKIESRRNQP